MYKNFLIIPKPERIASPRSVVCDFRINIECSTVDKIFAELPLESLRPICLAGEVFMR